jgi:hypothetical protein
MVRSCLDHPAGAALRWPVLILAVSGRPSEVTTPEESIREAEVVAEEYEEEAALPDPDDVKSLVVRVRKIEERLATIEEYLGRPPASAGTLEERLEDSGPGL